MQSAFSFPAKITFLLSMYISFPFISLPKLILSNSAYFLCFFHILECPTKTTFHIAVKILCPYRLLFTWYHYPRIKIKNNFSFREISFNITFFMVTVSYLFCLSIFCCFLCCFGHKSFFELFSLIYAENITFKIPALQAMPFLSNSNHSKKKRSFTMEKIHPLCLF